MASGPGFLRRDVRISDGQQEVYCKLWGTADKPPENLHIGDNVNVYNVQVRTFRSIVSLGSTDDTICNVCYIVILCTVVILALCQNHLLISFNSMSQHTTLLPLVAGSVIINYRNV